LENTDGSLSFIRSNSYNRALIEYDNGNIRVSVNGNLLLTGFQTFNFTGYLGFTASTGGSNDNHSIRNAIIYTDMPPSEAGGINGELITCPGETISIGTSTTAGYNYSWIPTTGLNSPNIANPILTSVNTTDTVQSIVYKVQTSFTNNPGCFSNDSIRVTIRPQPKINFGRPGICLNDAVATFTDSSSTKDPASLPFSYLWFFDDPSATASNPNFSTLKNPSHIYSAAAIYQVKSKVTSAAGCVDSLTVPFTVNGSIPTADLILSSDRNFCSNEKIVLIDKSTVNFGSLTKIEIFWDTLNSPSASTIDENPMLGKNYSYQYASFSQPAEKSITLKYEVYSGITCKSTIIHTFTLVSSPVVSFSSVTPRCDNDSPFLLTEAAEITGANGIASFSGNHVTIGGLFIPQMAGSFPIQYLFINTAGCRDSATQTVVVNTSPDIDAGIDQLVPEGRTVVLAATATGGSNLQYNWLPGSFLNNSQLLQPLCTPLQDIAYRLEVNNAEGCVTADSIKIKVLFQPRVPNVFSPNGDGIYDTWQIKYLIDYPNCRIQVFSRSGQLVFQSVGYGTAWDGTFKGQPLPIGTYYYMIQPGLGLEVIRGSVSLIR
jgi:gliding motility-associated-like protein